jgi:hypothetical protein
MICEPGTRLGGRYRLEDRVGASDGWSSWKAIDERLARAVTMLTFAGGFPRIGGAVTAARAAGRLTDPHLARVFDVEENPEHAYVVLEWAGGEALDDLLAGGPLSPGLAAEIIAESAEALASAHAAGVSHLCLTPGSLRWTPGGGVKITGLGVDAALAGASADDPALADTRCLGRLLYAALTARWPGADRPGLPRAPEAGGYPLGPRQVRAGVPAGLDGVCCRALSGRAALGGPPVTTPAGLASALRQVMPAPAAPRPVPGYAALTAGTGFWPAGGAPYPPRASSLAGPGSRGARAGRRPAAWVVACIAAALVVIAAGLGLSRLGHHGATQGRGDILGTGPSVAGTAVRDLAPVAARGFDPLSSAAEDPGDENTSEAPFAVDGDPGTAWHTQYYLGSPRFGGLKSGTGLILDMGRRVEVSSVTVTLGPVPGANVRAEVGNSDTRAPATLGTFTTIGRKRDASGRVRFTARAAVKGRFVLIWFTRLPPQAPGSTGVFEAEIFGVTVRGAR